MIYFSISDQLYHLSHKHKFLILFLSCLIILCTNSIQNYKQFLVQIPNPFRINLPRFMQTPEPNHQIYNLPLRVRGDHIKSFKNIGIISNHYAVSLTNFEKIVIFSVKFFPAIAYDNSKLRNQLLKKSMDQIRKYIANPVISGMNIYSLSESEVSEFQVIADEFQIKIKQVKVYNTKENPKVLLTFLNNGLRNIMANLNYAEIGKTGKYFNTKDKQPIDNLFMFSGFRSNFVYLEKGYYLRVDSAKKIIRNQTVLQCIDELCSIHKGKQKQQRRNIIRQTLANNIIMTNYGKTRYFKIVDIIFGDTVSSMQIGEDNKVSLKEYYEVKYKITIQNSKQPLIQVEDKKSKGNQDKKTLLVPELCLMTGIPDDFDENRRKKISDITIKNPSQKIKEIEKLMTELKENERYRSLRQLGIKIQSKLTSVDAKQIPTPTLQLGGKNAVQSGKEAFFNLFNKPIYQSKHDIKCAIIFFKGCRVDFVLETFTKTAQNLEVNLTTKKYQIESSSKGLEGINKYIEKAVDQQFNVCLIVIGNGLKNEYKKIKVCALKNQIITQVFTQAKLSNKNAQSIITKVLLQIIAKRGNTLWVPKAKSTIEGCMLSAFDSSKMGNDTVLSICSSINSTYSSISSNTVVFNLKDDKFKHMMNLMFTAVDAYVKRNQKPPKEIFLFLNSCSGDQYSIYYDLFILPFTEKIKQVYTQNISFSVIMCNVKTSERFFQVNGQSKNVPAGTVVASQLVSQFYDFFLISQQSTKGSTVPNHYKVIYSNSKIQEGLVQELIFSQCFNYVNWCGSIKIPAILQYAKKCVKFKSEIIENCVVHDSLNNKLYFI